MKDIQKIHEELFTFLQSWSEKARGSDDVNPYFYMRSVRDDRFKKGYWFPGNDNYLCISFWAGGDTHHKTPNVYFEISEKDGCRGIIVAKDSELKFGYFEKLASKLNSYPSQYKYVVNKSAKKCYKIFSKIHGDYKQALEEFIHTDKIIIDNFLKQQKPIDLEEFITRFDFIEQKNFDSMYSRVMKQREIIQNEYIDKVIVFNSLAKLPFALLKIGIENYQGVKSTTVEDLPPNAKWIFITGENGYGKTTLLQAIALGLNNNPDLEKYIEEEKTRIEIELVHNNEKAYPIRTKGGISQVEGINFGDFTVGYGPARLNVQPVDSENKDFKGSQNVKSLFDNTHTLKNINYELFASKNTDTTLFDELESIIKDVTNERISKVDVNKREVMFVERLSDGDELEAMPLNKLAAGFRSIINMVFDIYLQFVNIHKHYRHEDFYGIVLIDEIENHLHPILQKELPDTLSKVFPRIQFIASTHSPIPLLGAPKNSVILKANRSKENGVTIERLDDKIDFPNLLPNTILTSPIFGFEGIISNTIGHIEDIETAETYSEVETIKKLKLSLGILKTKEKILG